MNNLGQFLDEPESPHSADDNIRMILPPPADSEAPVVYTYNLSGTTLYLECRHGIVWSDRHRLQRLEGSTYWNARQWNRQKTGRIESLTARLEGGDIGGDNNLG